MASYVAENANSVKIGRKLFVQWYDADRRRGAPAIFARPWIRDCAFACPASQP